MNIKNNLSILFMVLGFAPLLATQYHFQEESTLVSLLLISGSLSSWGVALVLAYKEERLGKRDEKE